MRLAHLLLAFAVLILAGAAPASAQKRIAFSFDDVPRHAGAFFTPDERAKRLNRALKAAGVKQAAFFVTVGNVAQPHGAGAEKRIARYVSAGHVLANHSLSHTHLSKLSAEEYLADIDRAEAWMKGRKGRRPWFRYPFLDEGGRDKAKRDAVRAGLASRGLLNAYATIDASDWNIEALAAQALKAGKKLDMDALRDLYVESHVEAAEFYDGLARRTLGRSPAHMIVLHETDIAALYIPDLVRALRQKGWKVITADEAFADPISKMRPDVPHAQGTITEALAWEKGLPAPRWYERNNIRIANAVFAERVLKEKPSQ